MSCLKCGRETAEDNVFCEACLENMAAHPVKPGIRVTIPKRPKSEPAHPVVKTQTPEEIIEKLHKRIGLLVVLILVLFVGLCISVGVIAYHHATTEHGGFGIGQNYSTEAPDNVDHGR